MILLRYRIQLVGFSLLAATLLALAPAQAQVDTLDDLPLITNQGEARVQEQAFRQSAGYALTNRLTLGVIVARVILVVIGLTAVAFVVMLIYGGYLWLTSAGNSETIDKGKKLILMAILGLAVILSAYVITYFVIDQVLEATQGGVGLDQGFGQSIQQRNLINGDDFNLSNPIDSVIENSPWRTIGD